MTPEEVVDVLMKAAAFDQRTIGQADVLAWHEVIGRIDREDALTAVTRHYTESRDRIMPADVVRLVRVIREERQRPERHEVRELPGRYEPDADRDARKQANLKRLRRIAERAAAKLSMDRELQKAANAAALEDALSASPDPETARSQFEAVRQAAERERGVRGPDRGTVVIQGPWWLDEGKREEHATALLAGLGRLHIDASANDQQSDETA